MFWRFLVSVGRTWTSISHYCFCSRELMVWTIVHKEIRVDMLVTLSPKTPNLATPTNQLEMILFLRYTWHILHLWIEWQVSDLTSLRLKESACIWTLYLFNFIPTIYGNWCCRTFCHMPQMGCLLKGALMTALRIFLLRITMALGAFHLR